MRRYALPLLLVLFLFATGTAYPQAGVSAVRGVVRDQSQAVIPGATITLTNTATNVARTTTSNEVGIYVFPAVIPGPYRITMEAAGFQKFEGTLQVMVQTDATVDGTMAVGQTSTQVEVQDVTPLVRVDSPTLGHVLENQRIEQLPINGRGYQALLATVPGIDSTGIPQSYGMRTNTSVTLFDGTPVNESYEGWDFGRPPGLDSIAEVQVEVNNSSAKFQRPMTIILSSKSGTNQVHGDLFWTNRNSGYGVARRRQDVWTKAPFLNRNEFGASLGGPVVIPKVYNGKDKTFFFFSWEESRNPSASTQYWPVPTDAMRNGDMRGLIDDTGRLFQLYDPMTTNPTTWVRQPLSYNNVVNTINPARLSPTAKYLLDITPKATEAGVNPLIENNYIGLFKGPNSGRNISIRGDQRVSDKDLVYGRFSYNWSGRITPYGGQPMLNKVAGTELYDQPNQTAGGTWVRTISPTMTNEFVASFTRNWYYRGMGDNKTNYVGDVLGLPNPFKEVNWPGITGMGLDQGDNTFQYGTDGLFTLISNIITFQDNVTKLKGKHELQFGFHTRWELLNNSRGAYPSDFNFSSMATSLYDPESDPEAPDALPYTGYDLANFYLGVVNANVSFLRPAFNFRRREYAGYFQDNWKVTPRLTLNLGLRYELRPPIFDTTGTLTSFDLSKGAYVIGLDSVDQYLQKKMTLPSILQALSNQGGKILTYSQAGYPKHLINMPWNELGPRLGLAYRALEGKKQFVIRSGFRMSYYPQKMQDWAEGQYSAPPGSVPFSFSWTDPTLSPDGLQNYGMRTVPQYIAGKNTGDSLINVNNANLISRGDFAARVLPTDYKNGGVADWNLTFEKAVGGAMVARVAYVGNYGYNSQHWVDYNDATPTYIWYATKKTSLPSGEFANVASRPYNNTSYGNINFWSPIGFSWHKSFQFELERRFTKGLGFQIFYRTGKTLLTNQDTDGTQGGETVRSTNYYLPGTVPTDIKERDRRLNYRLDNNTPKHQIQWNWIADIPIGKGKKFGSNMNSVLNKIVGGWQLAGIGRWRTNYVALNTGFWDVDQNIQIYGYKYPIQDCTGGGKCYPAYLYYNGYIPPNQINSYDANGKPNGYMGIPSDYKPAMRYLVQWGQTALPPNAPQGTVVKDYWASNNVWIPLTNGKIQRTTYNTQLNPWKYQYIKGVNQWFQDASLFKFVNLRERVNLRFNVDFFNVFNNPNNPNSVASTGILSVRNSGSNARVTQLTLRLQW